MCIVLSDVWGESNFELARMKFSRCTKKGYANKYIYEKLIAEGRLTLAYSTFNGHLRKRLHPTNQKARKNNPPEMKKKFEIPRNTKLI